jgi:hypothetical protein
MHVFDSSYIDSSVEEMPVYFVPVDMNDITSATSFIDRFDPSVWVSRLIQPYVNDGYDPSAIPIKLDIKGFDVFKVKYNWWAVPEPSGLGTIDGSGRRLYMTAEEDEFGSDNDAQDGQEDWSECQQRGVWPSILLLLGMDSLRLENFLRKREAEYSANDFAMLCFRHLAYCANVGADSVLGPLFRFRDLLSWTSTKLTAKPRFIWSAYTSPMKTHCDHFREEEFLVCVGPPRTWLTISAIDFMLHLLFGMDWEVTDDPTALGGACADSDDATSVANYAPFLCKWIPHVKIGKHYDRTDPVYNQICEMYKAMAYGPID